MHPGGLLLVARAVPRTSKIAALVVGALLGLTGGVVFAALAIGGDVADAYDRIVAATDGPDLALSSETAPGELNDRLRSVPGVTDVADITTFEVAALTADGSARALGPDPDDPCSTGTGDVAATPEVNGRRADTPLLLPSSGRLPRSDAQEVALPGITAERLGLDVGDRIVFAGDCSAESQFAEPIDVEVSGIGVSVFDAPEVGSNPGAEILLISPRLRDELIEHGMVADRSSLVWLDRDASATEITAAVSDASVIFNLTELRDAVRTDLAPDATALRVFAALVAASALVILGPVLGRVIRASHANAPTLRALGMSVRSLTAVGAIRGAAVGAVATVTLVITSLIVAGRVPTGRARQFHDALSFAPGPLDVAAGALVVVAVSVVIGAAVSQRVVRRMAAASASPSTRAGSRYLARLALGPMAKTGARFALEPGSLDDPTPVRSGLSTAAIAIAVVVGVITFSDSLGHLRETPRLYGVNWDVFTLTEDADAFASALEDDPEVGPLARGTFFPPQQVTIGDAATEVWLMSFEAGYGRAVPTVTSGRAPIAPHELLIARELGETLGVDVGDVTELHLPTPETRLAFALGQDPPAADERVLEMEVVGVGVLPIGDGRLGAGASISLEGLRVAVDPTDRSELIAMVDRTDPAALLDALQENVDPELDEGALAALSSTEVVDMLVAPVTPEFVAFDAGGRASAAAKAIGAADGRLSEADFAEPPTPERVVNLDLSQAGRIPDAFSGLMSVVAIVVVVLLILVGGRQRRHDLAVMRALGCGRREVRRTLVAQAVTTVVAASLLVPIGIAVGRAAWLAYAGNLGVVPEAAVPVGTIAAALLVVLVCGLVAAVFAAVFAAHRPIPADLMPDE